MTVRLFRVILPVTDIEAAAQFYGAVIGEPGERVAVNRHYFGTGADGAILACCDPRGEHGSGKAAWLMHPLQYVYIAVDDLEAARGACAAAGATEITGIESQPWGETMFYALDPSETPSPS
ncbi:VOC family protein [Phenylobacterium sp.]|uniref:VOC family protein n=1 Tax=Phenylobacterium sp. TaxID=1871053 RepID=UPI0030F39270